MAPAVKSSDDEQPTAKFGLLKKSGDHYVVISLSIAAGVFMGAFTIGSYAASSIWSASRELSKFESRLDVLEGRVKMLQTDVSDLKDKQTVESARELSLVRERLAGIEARLGALVEEFRRRAGVP